MYSQNINDFVFYANSFAMLLVITYAYCGMMFKYVDHTDITDLIDINLKKIK